MKENTAVKPTVVGRSIRVRGLVQGVGFRPFVWTLAHNMDIKGHVINDSDGVLIEAWAFPDVLEIFTEGIAKHGLPLARIDRIESVALNAGPVPDQFLILKSEAGDANTSVGSDAATCAQCLDDTLSPFNRRYRYPFTNCTHCGPRLTIIKAIPYDRCNTSMAAFPLCAECNAEYENPPDRRYHAQPTACDACGPKAQLVRSDKMAFCLETLTQLDDLDAAASLIQKGEIVAVKGLGGFQIACDASNHQAVAKLRQRKIREAKPFALMARDIETVHRFCHVSQVEEELLKSTAAPIVIMAAKENNLSPAVAAGLNTLGFMLPYTPLHHLLMKQLDCPIVLTSGNLSDEPQVTENEDAIERLAAIADYVLHHNRDIVNRVDDSVVRIMNGAPRTIRRARGYAPVPVALPPGFNDKLSILAMGAELKNTACLIKGGSAVLTQHIGDLADARTFDDYKKNLALYEGLFQHKPEHIAVDMHPEYLSTKLGKTMSSARETKLHEIQHHHAHIAACLAENNHPLDAGPVLGVALDGLGWGDDNSFWGGEFLAVDYISYERLGTFKPVALLGGTKAMLEPWRNTYAHIMAELGWAHYKMNFEELELTSFFELQPLATFAGMLTSGTNVPVASSCGRLFDAVAAAIGICRQRAAYEGQAAIELEAIVDQDELNNQSDEFAYPFAFPHLNGKGLPYIEPITMWQALLGDMILNTPAPVMAARFHKGLAKAIVHMVQRLTVRDEQRWLNKVALSGGVFQNKILLEQVAGRLEKEGYEVLTHRLIPANDGGISLGQAVICAARLSV